MVVPGEHTPDSGLQLPDSGLQLPDDELELDDEGLEVASDGTLYEHRRVVADKGQTLLRVDKFLMEHLRDTSRARIQRAAEAGCIHVNDRPVKSNYRVKPFDVVTLMLDHPRFETEITAEDIPLRIVYEDDDLLVVDKAAGMVVHPGVGNYTGTLVNALAWHLREDPKYNPNDPNVGLVHRIDKDTSGLLVVAKTPEAKTHLCHQFFVHSTRRQYNALVWGSFESQEGTIEGNIARDPRDRQRMTVLPPGSDQGKPAVTHWRQIEAFGPVTLVECVLETGRTHQIRAHMKSIGHPLFSDERYGGSEILRGQPTAKYKQFVQNAFAICPRQALHARTLGFVHPRTRQELFFESPLPEDLTELINKWRAYARTLV